VNGGACGAAVTAISQIDMKILGAGAKACGAPAHVATLGSFVSFSEPLLVAYVAGVANECGYGPSILDAKFTTNTFPNGTCANAIHTAVAGVGDCPAACIDAKDAELGSGQHYCVADEKQYTQATCGPAAAPFCAGFVANAKKWDFANVAAGFGKCETEYADNASMQFFFSRHISYAKKGADFLRDIVLGIEKGCVPTPPPTAVPTAKPTAQDSGGVANAPAKTKHASFTTKLPDALGKAVWSMPRGAKYDAVVTVMVEAVLAKTELSLSDVKDAEVEQISTGRRRSSGYQLVITFKAKVTAANAESAVTSFNAKKSEVTYEVTVDGTQHTGAAAAAS
jgi:hypothetical protein